MDIRVAINGFGRIGRDVFRSATDHTENGMRIVVGLVIGGVGYAKPLHGYTKAEHDDAEPGHAESDPRSRVCPAFM